MSRYETLVGSSALEWEVSGCVLVSLSRSQTHTHNLNTCEHMKIRGVDAIKPLLTDPHDHCVFNNQLFRLHLKA